MSAATMITTSWDSPDAMRMRTEPALAQISSTLWPVAFSRAGCISMSRSWVARPASTVMSAAAGTGANTNGSTSASAPARMADFMNDLPPMMSSGGQSRARSDRRRLRRASAAAARDQDLEVVALRDPKLARFQREDAVDDPVGHLPDHQESPEKHL